MLFDSGRAQYVPITDEEAVQAFEYLSRTEGIIPAIDVRACHRLRAEARADDVSGSDYCRQCLRPRR